MSLYFSCYMMAKGSRGGALSYTMGELELEIKSEVEMSKMSCSVRSV